MNYRGGFFMIMVLLMHVLLPGMSTVAGSTISQRRQILEVATIPNNLRASGGDPKVSAPQVATNTVAVTDGVDLENDGLPVSRTATGGVINTLLSFLTLLAFIGNGAFMVYTFWLSK
jgi:hypothetical protein